MKLSSSIILFVLLSFCGLAQQQIDSTQHIHNPKFKHHRLAWKMAFTHLPTGTSGTRSYVNVPSWGFNYDYWFNKHFGLGIRTNMDVLEYSVKLSNQEVLRRHYPFSTTFVATAEFFPNGLFHIGPGYEYDKFDGLFIMELGARYIYEIRHDFALMPGFTYYTKEAKYDSWAFSLEAMFRF